MQYNSLIFTYSSKYKSSLCKRMSGTNLQVLTVARKASSNDLLLIGDWLLSSLLMASSIVNQLSLFFVTLSSLCITGHTFSSSVRFVSTFTDTSRIELFHARLHVLQLFDSLFYLLWLIPWRLYFIIFTIGLLLSSAGDPLCSAWQLQYCFYEQEYIDIYGYLGTLCLIGFVIQSMWSIHFIRFVLATVNIIVLAVGC